VVAPAHDGLVGDNVIATLGALHRVTAVRLATAAARFAEAFAPLPRPLVAVLVGGNSRHHRLTPALAGRLGEQLRGLADQGCGLAVTPSRRTGAANLGILRQRLAGSGAYLWDFQGENPYFALLASADVILVTEDSVTMACEAAFTGKPLYVVALEGGGRRHAAFHAALRQAGHAQPFAGRLEFFPGKPLDETGRVAALLAARLASRFAAA
jgi:mitochondrial fission protein ELM1